MGSVVADHRPLCVFCVQTDMDISMLELTTPNDIQSPAPSQDANSLRNRRLFVVITIVLILIGSLVRIGIFLQAQSLWIDEAVLADNILSRDYAGLTQPLDHNQLAPIGYLWLTKLSTQLLGTGELALRLVSLIAGLVTLPALWLMSRRLLSPIGAMVAVALGVFSLSLIDYSSEVKPYGVDVLATTTLLWLGLRAMQHDWHYRSLVPLSLVSAVAVWLSMTAVFVVVGIYMAAAMTNLNATRRNKLVPIITTGLVAGISFGLHFMLFLRPSMGSPVMQQFWANDFLPLPPRSLKQIEWFVLTPLQYFTDPAGLSAIGLALSTALIGIALWWRKQRGALLVILMPVVLLMIASALKKYPIPTSAQAGEHWSGRLILFTLPIAFFAIATAIERLHSLSSRAARAGALVIVMLLLIHPMLDLTRQLKAGQPAGDVRNVFEHLIKKQQPGDVVYPNWPMHQLAAYYRHQMDLSDTSRWLKTHPVIVRAMLTDDAWTHLNDWARWEQQLIEFHGKRVWLLISHEPSAGSKPDEKFLRSLMNRHGQILDELKTDEASLYLVQVNQPSP